MCACACAWCDIVNAWQSADSRQGRRRTRTSCVPSSSSRGDGRTDRLTAGLGDDGPAPSSNSQRSCMQLRAGAAVLSWLAGPLDVEEPAGKRCADAWMGSRRFPPSLHPSSMHCQPTVGWIRLTSIRTGQLDRIDDVAGPAGSSASVRLILTVDRLWTRYVHTWVRTSILPADSQPYAAGMLLDNGSGGGGGRWWWRWWRRWWWWRRWRRRRR